MLPVTPAGQSGWPAGPTRIGPAATPSMASAARAHDRPAANSARRPGPAVRRAASSAGNSSVGFEAGLPVDSAAATADGRRAPISPASPGRDELSAAITAGALLGPQRHPDRVRVGSAGVAPDVRLVAPEVQRAPGA